MMPMIKIVIITKKSPQFSFLTGPCPSFAGSLNIFCTCAFADINMSICFLDSPTKINFRIGRSAMVRAFASDQFGVGSILPTDISWTEIGTIQKVE